jgi:hypothetical protein
MLGSSVAKETTWARVVCFFMMGLLIFVVVPEFAEEMPADEIQCSTNAWCATNGFDVFFTKLLVAPDPRAADYASHAFTFGVSPILAFSSALYPLCFQRAHPDKGKVAGQDSLLVLGSALVALGINSWAKRQFKRQRPCFYYGDEGETEASTMPNEQFVSFFSGDTTIGVVTCVVGLVLATLRQRNYAAVSVRGEEGVKGLFAAASILSAFLGSILRVVGYMHWMTDVITGVLCGVVCGALPYLLFKPVESESSQPLINKSSDGGMP